MNYYLQKMTSMQAIDDASGLLERANDHLFAASRITDIDDMRYFDMRDLEQVRNNLYLALELLQILKRETRRAEL